MLFSCWSGPENPAVHAKYDFNDVEKLFIYSISDHSNMLGSGAMVSNSLTHNFLKYGYTVNASNHSLLEVQIDQGKNSLELHCIITEFTDSEMIVVPYRHEDRGYTKTVVQQTSDIDLQEEKSKSSQLQTSTTTTHAGKVREGNMVEYTHCKVGIMLKMIDKRSGDLVWSNSYWYSGLELQRTIDTCLKNSVIQINKLFQ
jgi:hypothetical protein